MFFSPSFVFFGFRFDSGLVFGFGDVVELIKICSFFSYEPELHPGVTYKCKDPKATLKIFSTGSITVTAPSVANVQRAVEHIYPLVEEFQKPKTKSDVAQPIPKIPGKEK